MLLTYKYNYGKIVSEKSWLNRGFSVKITHIHKNMNPPIVILGLRENVRGFLEYKYNLSLVKMLENSRLKEGFSYKIDI